MNPQRLKVIMIAFLCCRFASACSTGPAVEDQLRAHETALRDASSTGSSLSDVLVNRAQHGVISSDVMSAEQCRKSYVEILNQPEECTGGSQVNSEIFVARDWTGFETRLMVMYGFDANERLVSADYQPRYIWF